MSGNVWYKKLLIIVSLTLEALRLRQALPIHGAPPLLVIAWMKCISRIEPCEKISDES